LILAANRDEFLARPTAPLAWWQDRQDILAGRDLQDGGTWLGVSRSGNFGVLTNYREKFKNNGTISRGEIVTDYISSDLLPKRYLNELQDRSARYRGFNLLLGDAWSFWYYSNRGKGFMEVPPGYHGLSNHLFNSDWPKVERGKTLLAKVLEQKSFTPDSLFAILQDTSQPAEHLLPDTGVGREWEKMLAPIFITSDTYGTRSSAILMVRDNGSITFSERTFSHGHHGPQTENERCFTIE